MNDILIITSYFPPEMGAASNRISNLSEGLSQNNFNVSVVTPLPNYPTGKIFKSFRKILKKTSIENNITIHRLWIYATNSKNKIKRLFAMLSYSFSLICFFLFSKTPKTIIIQSPPLLVAFTSIFFLRFKKNSTIILNVSDLWPLAGLELNALKKGMSYNILKNIEAFNYKYADVILGQSDEILSHITGLFPHKKTLLYRNYPNFNPKKIINEEKKSTQKLNIVYAGLIGAAQDILSLCKNLDYNIISLHIYGDGMERNAVIKYIDKNPNADITYHGELSKDALHNVLPKYDFTIVPLQQRIYGSVPSKIFEYARLGIPILYFGGGEGNTIISKYQLGWIAEEGNYNSLNSCISKIYKNKQQWPSRKQIQDTGITCFDFEKQLKLFIDTVLK